MPQLLRGALQDAFDGFHLFVGTRTVRLCHARLLSEKVVASSIHKAKHLSPVRSIGTIDDMKFAEIASRMTGFSCPVFGVSWEPPTPDVAIARRVITHLEDRRILYGPTRLEDFEYCQISAGQIRAYLTRVLSENTVGADLNESLRSMRSACRKFMNKVDEIKGRDYRFRNDRRSFNKFLVTRHLSYEALGEMRGVFGVQIGMLALKYGLDVEGDLASILPEYENS